ncbi:MAG: tetratricopeptide repeat protein [Spirochaetes bacterium]|nr:tetratricopeptide repeat protein [Spirochaetota bacterium]
MNFINKNIRIKKLLEKNKTEKAVDYLKKLISNEKNIIINSLILSQIYLIKKNLIGAIDILENLLVNQDIFDKELQFEVYKLLGDYYHKQENFNKSFLNYQLALAIKKDDHQILQKMAHIYLDVNNFEKAGNLFFYLVKEEPNNIYFKCILAYYYIEAHKYNYAEKLLKEILSANPNNCTAKFYSGYLSYSKGNYNDALQLFNECCHDKGLIFKCNYYSGKSELSLKNYQIAAGYFEEAKNHIDFECKLTLDLYYSLIICYEKLNNYQKALIELKRIFTINPEFKDIKKKMLSKDYKEISNTNLVDYNICSAFEFYNYCMNFIKKIHFKFIENIKTEENIVILHAKTEKINNSLTLLDNFINYSKKEKYILIFVRTIQLTEVVIQNFIKDINHKEGRILFFTSQDVSSKALEYSRSKSIRIITATLFNDIINELK